MSDTQSVPFGGWRTGLCVVAIAVVVAQLALIAAYGWNLVSVLSMLGMAGLILAQILGWRHDVRKARS